MIGRLVALILIGGCGASIPRAGLGDLLDADMVSRARVNAPDLVAEAEAASADAESAHEAGDDAAASDHVTRARLLLDAAVVESNRIEIEEERLEVEARAEAHSALAARIEAERGERAALAARERAAGIALREAARAFEVAETDETRRLARRGASVTQAHRQASVALLGRAELLLAAARALEAPEAGLEELAEAIAEARGLTDATESMRAADRAHRHAMRLLGEARTGTAPTPEQRRGLIAMLAERNLEAHVGADGVVVIVRANGEVALAEILAAHPHGPVILVGSAQDTRRLRATLVENAVPDSRLAARVERAPLRAILSGYGDAL